jgi:hypothetical protein
MNSDQFPIGERVTLPGHFHGPVVLEAVRQIGSGFECRVRLADGSPDAACCTELTNNARRDFLLTASSIVSICQQAPFILVFSNRGYDSRKQFLLERGWQSKAVYLDGSDGCHLEDPEAPAR